MTKNKYVISEHIVRVEYTFRENGVIVKTEQNENSWSRDVYTFPDGGMHKTGWYKDERDASGKLLKRSFVSDNGDRRDVYFEDGEIKKIIRHLENGKKLAVYISKTKDRVMTYFDEDGLMRKRIVWNVDNRLILEQDFFKNGVIAKHCFFVKSLPGYVDVFNEDGKKLYTEFMPNEKKEIKRRVYKNGKGHFEIYNRNYIFLYDEYLLDNGKYHSMRVYRDGDVVKCKTYLDENGVVREQSFYCDGIITRTEFLDTEGVVVGIVDYDALGNIKTARQLDNEGLEYRDTELVATDKIPEVTLREKDLLPYKEEDVLAINSR